ncbi:MAG: 4-hydroxy-3-methylbut-2-enyl diphosphate reductase [Chloroflexi bacterium]|nr:4-hydroxy-3-methylbut-2-enyl diphosphate reductase [Chloroflexota bacterium]
MEVLLAKEMGFCFGVKRAVRLLEEAARDGPVDSLGSVVHNPQVVARLQERGVRVVASPEEVRAPTVAIPSHGAGPGVADRLAEGRRVVDTTCPIVRRAQQAAARLREEGFYVVVFGESDHPEVRAVLAWAQGQGLATTDPFGLPRPLPRWLGVIPQTTQHLASFANFVRDLMSLPDGKGKAAPCPYSELRVVTNVLCQATQQRQQSAQDLARQSDVVIVVGGYNSANTRRLAELCSPLVETHHVQTAAEIDPRWLQGQRRVGVTAGASTPEGSVEEVVELLRKRLENG